jgi:hypothetical protein
MNGREMAESLRDARAGITLIYTSGFTQDIIASHGVLYPGVTYARKLYTSGAITAHTSRQPWRRTDGRSLGTVSFVTYGNRTKAKRV